MDLDFVDLFAGAGGWDVGAKALGLGGVGIDNDTEVVATRKAAELDTLEGDVRMYRAEDFEGVDLMVASPPCQSLSVVGKRIGLREVGQVVEAVRSGSLLSTQDLRTGFMTYPLDWALRMKPRAIAWEQVPAALPIWEASGEVLAAEGYSVWTGMLNAEQYGAPQTRKRAIFMARLDGEVVPPRPTHSKYHARTPEKFDHWVEPWVAIEAVLDPEDYTHLGDVCTSRGTLREVSKPAGTVVASSDNGNYRWTNGDEEQVVSPEEFGVLQTFPADFPWQGPLAARYRQVGNAIPPLLAQAILAGLIERAA